MSIYESILLFAAGGVMLLSLFASNPRGALWCAAIVIDLVVSTAYWRSGQPYADVFTGLCDFSVCIFIYFLGRWRWELGLFLLFQLSLLTSICDFAASLWAPGWIDHDTYSSVLESINYLSFLLVGGVSGLALAGAAGFARQPWRWLRPSVLPLFGQNPSTGR